jgi:hypothetical protein
MFYIMAKSYIVLLLNEKVKIIEAKEREKLSVGEIMMQFKWGKLQVCNTLGQKDKTKWKAKVTDNEEINEVVWEW